MIVFASLFRKFSIVVLAFGRMILALQNRNPHKGIRMLLNADKSEDNTFQINLVCKWFKINCSIGLNFVLNSHLSLYNSSEQNWRTI